jgi:hypothetical protein
LTRSTHGHKAFGAGRADNGFRTTTRHLGRKVIGQPEIRCGEPLGDFRVVEDASELSQDLLHLGPHSPCGRINLEHVAFAAIGCSPTTEYNKVMKRSALE